jgi:hypothetical protein
MSPFGPFSKYQRACSLLFRFRWLPTLLISAQGRIGLAL